MSIFGVLITYACCWWLVLFMVLPWRVKIADNPTVGLAASAPVRPMLKRKMALTSFFALIPTAMLYILVGQAHAEENDIYHAKSHISGTDCGVAYTPPDDLNAVDSDATMNKIDGMPGGEAHVGISIPTRDYTGNHGGQLRDSDIYLGDVAVGQDGKARYRGQVLGEPSSDCK